MKLSKSQQDELIVWEYFMPQNCNWAKRTDKDIEMFFEWSEHGKHKEIANIPTYLSEGRTYFHALYWGKKRAGINIHELYEQGVLDGVMPYFTLLGGFAKTKKWWQFWKSPNVLPPKQVVDFIKKEMFKGVDSVLIENISKNVSKKKFYQHA